MRLPILALASFASGAAALAFELLWVRRLGELFGSTIFAVNVVLAVFFLGLGIGARLGGTLADRRQGSIGLYVSLELVIAISGLAFLPLAGLIDQLYTNLAPAEWSRGPALLVQGLGAVLLLSVPTLAMGASLPALTRHVVRRSDHLAARLGIIYGVNTIGGAVGAALAMVVLLPRLGMPMALAAAGGLNLVAVILALCGRLRPGEPGSLTATEAPTSVRPAGPGPERVVLLAALIAGFVSVGYEVLWTRALSARFVSTIYSFTTILVVFLLCLGLGSLLVGWLERRGWVNRRAAALVLTAAGVAGLLSVTLLGRVPTDLAYSVTIPDLRGRQWHEFRHAILVMAIPLVFFGVNLPLLVRVLDREARSVGRNLGRVYLASTVGSVLAPLLIGFVILPAIGLRPSLLLGGWVLVLFGALVLFPWSGLRGAALGLGVTAALVPAILTTLSAPPDVRLWRFTDEDTLIEYREGVSASISVAREPDGNVFLKVDNNYRLGDARTYFAQQRQGLLPLLLHPGPESALFIGMGTGSSAGAAVAFGEIAVDALDIIPELGDLLHHFSDINFDLVERAARREDVRILSVDARHFVRATERRYDVVVGDLFVPWRSGEGAMYTREHFDSVREVLTDGGVFCQWLPLYQLRPEEFRTITATFREVFPGASLWWLYYNAIEPVVGLCGTRGALTFDAPGLDARMHASGRDSLLTRAGMRGPREVMGSWIANLDELDEWLSDASTESRDHPHIEFDAPMGRFGNLPDRSRANMTRLLGLATPTPGDPPFEDLTADQLQLVRAFQRGVASYLGGRYASLYLGDPVQAVSGYAAAYLDVPDHALMRLLVIQSVQEAIDARRPDVAEIGLSALERHEQSRADAHVLRALLAISSGDLERARIEARTALGLDPMHEDAWRLLQDLENERSP